MQQRTRQHNGTSGLTHPHRRAERSATRKDGMAKQRTFFTRLLQRVKRDSAVKWCVGAADDFAGATSHYNAKVPDRALGLTGDRFVKSIQAEALLCALVDIPDTT